MCNFEHKIVPKHLHQNNNSSIEADMKVEINKKRLEYLLTLCKMSVDDLLSLLNKGRKQITGAAEHRGDSIDLGVLKRIGEIFDEEVSFLRDYCSCEPMQAAVSSPQDLRSEQS